MGLFVSKDITEDHAVRIRVENARTSNKGNERTGNIFTFSMPLNKVQEQQSGLLPQSEMGQIDQL